MSEPLNIAALQRVAESANDFDRPWEWEHAYPQRVTRVGDVALIAECFEDPDSPSRFAEFIATFDPPMVLRLLDLIASASPSSSPGEAARAQAVAPENKQHEGP